jgi:hypothetical protein
MTAKNAATPDPLVHAIADKLAAQDNASRLQRATALAASLFPVEDGSPKGSELGQDPGEKAVGCFGVFGSNIGDFCFFGTCFGYKDSLYKDKDGDTHHHFRPITISAADLAWIKDNEA